MKLKLKTSLWGLGLFWITFGLRLFQLGFPTDHGEPIFDEKHYAPQAYQILTNGTWMENNPGYGLVVHPPVGKWCIAFGEWLFGYTPFGWRFSSVLFGAGITVLIFLIIKLLTSNLAIGIIAGLLSIFDTVLFVASRMAMLDIFLTFFVLLALYFLLLDNQLTNRKSAKNPVYPFGPKYGIRWYRLLTAISLGLAVGVKISAIYYVVGLLLISLSLDWQRRSANTKTNRPFQGVLRYDLLPTLYNYLFIVLVVFLASNWAWFYNDASVFRYQAVSYPDSVPGWGWLPDSLRSFWYYQKVNFNFHTHLTNSAGYHHAWESKPWTWPMSLRPMLYHFDYQAGATKNAATISAVMLIGSPILWWFSLPMLGWGIWRILTKHSVAWLVVISGYLLGILPWFIYMDRQMYFFYATLLAPFLIMGISLAIGDIIYSSLSRKVSLLLTSSYLSLVVVNFIWLWPIITGQKISLFRWYLEMWLPSWS